jgi:hypothetical protein
MKKQIREVEVRCGIHWDGLISINKIQEDILELKKMGATHINIYARISWSEDAFIEFTPMHLREETEEEMLERVAREESIVKEKKERELKQLEFLKSKYESK